MTAATTSSPPSSAAAESDAIGCPTFAIGGGDPRIPSTFHVPSGPRRQCSTPQLHSVGSSYWRNRSTTPGAEDVTAWISVGAYFPVPCGPDTCHLPQPTR